MCCAGNAEELEAKDKRIAELEAENNLFNDHLVKAAARIEELEAALSHAKEQITELEQTVLDYENGMLISGGE